MALLPALLALPLFTQDPDALARLRQHYDAAIEELVAGDVSRLSTSQVERRLELITVLRSYRERAEFGRNLDFPGARVPYFVDAGGRRCAVAELLHASGEDVLVERVHDGDNHAWIVDLRGDEDFECWLERVGLTLEEAARIQAPPGGYWDYGPGGNPGQPPRSSNPSGKPTPTAGGKYGGPGDTTPAGTPGGGSGGATSGAPRGPLPAGPTTSTGTGGSPSLGPSNRPTTPGLTMTSDDSWWLWWEYNKADFLRPRRLDLMSAPASGDDAQQALGRFADSMRAVLGKTFDETSKDGDAGVRAAAAIAYGRCAGASAVPRLVELLSDANMVVREGAILALGASGAEAAVEPLLAIARAGSIDEQQRTRISPTAEAHAIVALGLGRRLGFPERVDRELAARIQKRSKPERESLGCAAMIYQRLAPCAEIEALAFQLAGDDSEAPSVRCRAVEALAQAKAADTLSKLQDLLSGPRLDLRRSAALALGEHTDPLALAPLMTAFELESESLTRGFILTSIGRRGGPVAREFLLRALAGHPKSLHSWSALALGILARKSHDAGLSKIVCEAGQKESNRQAQSAYWIAAGLIGADEALPLLSEALSTAADPRSRMYAASALALLGSEDARAALHARLTAEPMPQVRAAIALSLGGFGNGQDLDLIAGELNNLNQPELQAQTASALAFHATYDSMRRLGELAMRKDGPSLRRAAAIEGVGMLLGKSVPLSLMDVSRQANYTVFNEWMDGLYQTTL